ncbi:unnamed protein product [Mytilus edulis]|uniref:Uncharacterized protein n=1 Tax=Mytilus edulis TaxID=6550 RepID=A0A8S3TQ58_MYTED|nr:unnamed protein product [Mytilus edulis]
MLLSGIYVSRLVCVTCKFERRSIDNLEKSNIDRTRGVPNGANTFLVSVLKINKNFWLTMARSKITPEKDVWENSIVEKYYNRDHDIVPHEDPKDDPKYDEKNKLIRRVQDIVGTHSSGKPPLNIAIVGLPGGGKSSLLNTIFASFSTERWTEIVPFGSFGRAQEQRTTRFTSYVKDTYYKQNQTIILCRPFWT